MATPRKSRTSRRSRTAPHVLSEGRAKRVNIALALDAMASELDEMRAACVLVQITLRAQNADHDAEMESCLRTSVAVPLERKISELRSLIGALGSPASRASAHG